MRFNYYLAKGTLVGALGGLHAFVRWPYPILTESGGFQVMSLAPLRKLSEAGVTFRSHLDGAMVELTPERAMEVQILLGSDIAMQLDECVKLPAERSEIERAMRAISAAVMASPGGCSTSPSLTIPPKSAAIKLSL